MFHRCATLLALSLMAGCSAYRLRSQRAAVSVAANALIPTFGPPNFARASSSIQSINDNKLKEELLVAVVDRLSRFQGEYPPYLFEVAASLDSIDGLSILNGLAPLLNSVDASREDAAETILSYFISVKKGCDSDEFFEYFNGAAGDNNEKLVKLIVTCASSEGFAGLVMARCDQKQDQALWADHIIREVIIRNGTFVNFKIDADEVEARRQFDWLAAQPEWWMRAYAAQLSTLYYKSLRGSDAKEYLRGPFRSRLLDDADERVKELVN